jgi:hypothetical protein
MTSSSQINWSRLPTAWNGLVPNSTHERVRHRAEHAGPVWLTLPAKGLGTLVPPSSHVAGARRRGPALDCASLPRTRQSLLCYNRIMEAVASCANESLEPGTRRTMDRLVIAVS